MDPHLQRLQELQLLDSRVAGLEPLRDALQTLQSMSNDPKNKLRQDTLLKRWQALAENTLKAWPTHPEADP